MGKPTEDEIRMSERSDYGKLAEACESGDHVAALRQLRQDLAWSLENGPVTVVAQTAARLQSVLSELAELSRGSEATVADVLAERRAVRLAAKSSVSAGKGRVKRGG